MHNPTELAPPVTPDAGPTTPAGPLDPEVVCQVDFPDGSPSLTLNRREFLRVATVASAAAAVSAAGCQMPVESVVPYHDRPEELRRLGRPLDYATTLAGCPVLVRTREARPILVAPNPGHPAGQGITAAAQAALLDLYDPDRAVEPLVVGRGRALPAPVSWDEVTRAVISGLQRAGGGKTVLLTGPQSGPATTALLAELARHGVEHVSWAPLAPETRSRAWAASCGSTVEPWQRFDRARLILGFGADFLDRPRGNEPRWFADSRNPDAPDGMARFIALEGRLSLTGANADRRVRVRPSRLPVVALALAREVALVRRVGDYADVEALGVTLAPFTLERAATAAGLDLAVLRTLADELTGAAGHALVTAGEGACEGPGGAALALAVNLLNAALGSFGTTLPLEHGVDRQGEGGLPRLAALTEELRAGRVGLLLLHGVNPVFDAPASLDFAGALARVPLIVSLNDRVDETSALADFLAPASHPLEAWGDVRHDRQTVGVLQPALRPLRQTYGLLDILVGWGAAAFEAGVGGGKLAAAALAARDVLGGPVATVHSPGYHFLHRHWQTAVLPGAAGGGGTAEAWNEALRRGFVEGPAPVDQAPLRFDPASLTGLDEVATTPASGWELELFPHYALGAGASNNNGWLQELPDPISKITWGDWVAVPPRRFDELRLTAGDLLELSWGGQTVTLPAYRQAGMQGDTLAAPLGFGRTAAGLVGNEVGTNLLRALPCQDGRVTRRGLAVQLRPTGGRSALAIPQGSEVIDRKARPLLPSTTYAEYRQNPRAGTEQVPGGASAWGQHEYPKQRWAMSIDLARCNGCGQCALACQAENNIPVVGRRGVIDGREMSWIRIDRYYDAPRLPGEWPDSVWDGPLAVVEEPKTLFEPMLCQHCENAPCETVCPFVATMHSADGLNQQVYNRCVGTRYCANNCPFKVRRFNWFDYSIKRPSRLFNLLVPQMKEHAILNTRPKMALKNNPEVTVRGRGVMEKCSFCVQRIRDARAVARLDGRDVDRLPDGAVRPACMEACPSGAIVFGNIHDPASAVARTSASPRAMKLLEATGVKPSIAYLTKVRHE